MAPEKTLQKKFTSFLVGVITLAVLISNVPMAFATVADDYLLIITDYIHSYIRDLPFRNEGVQIAGRLATCLNQVSSAGTPNWQHTNSAIGIRSITSIESLRDILQRDFAHPCAAETEALSNYRTRTLAQQATVSYIAIIGDSRQNAITAARRDHYGDVTDAAFMSKLNAYSECLVSPTGSVPNWQFGGEPSDVAQLGRQVRENTSHPCYAARALVANHRPGDPADRSSGVANEPPPGGSLGATGTGVTATPTSTSAPSSTGGGGVSIDNRPLYQRIVEPNSQDVLTPGFATASTPSIPGLMNFLFDLLVRRILPLIIGVMVVFLVWGGYQYIMSAGDQAKVKQARDTILYSIIAMIIALSALTIVTVLNNLLLQTTP